MSKIIVLFQIVDPDIDEVVVPAGVYEVSEISAILAGYIAGHDPSQPEPLFVARQVDPVMEPDHVAEFNRR
jgi:hypothetical protein